MFNLIPSINIFTTLEKDIDTVFMIKNIICLSNWQFYIIKHSHCKNQNPKKLNFLSIDCNNKDSASISNLFDLLKGIYLTQFYLEKGK